MTVLLYQTLNKCIKQNRATRQSVECLKDNDKVSPSAANRLTGCATGWYRIISV